MEKFCRLLRKKNRAGQAVVEYLLVFIFIALISVKIIQVFGDFLGNSIGNLTGIVNLNVTTGVCERFCFFRGYTNGYDPGDTPP